MEEKEIALAALGVIVTLSQHPYSQPVIPDSTVKVAPRQYAPNERADEIHPRLSGANLLIMFDSGGQNQLPFI